MKVQVTGLTDGLHSLLEVRRGSEDWAGKLVVPQDGTRQTVR